MIFPQVCVCDVLLLCRLACECTCLYCWRPPALSYVPFGAARTSSLSYVPFGAAGVSYPRGAAAKNRAKSNVPRMVVFVPLSYQTGHFRWTSATIDFLVRNVGKGAYLRTLPLIYAPSCTASAPPALSYVPFGTDGAPQRLAMYLSVPMAPPQRLAMHLSVPLALPSA